LTLINTVLGRLREVSQQSQNARPQYEVIAAHVHDILRLITELSGRSITEHIMDKVFSTFCIGK
jgi:tRNA U34 5-carboxymethylaminomethyl modifying GTPase MnmE/TrmE